MPPPVPAPAPALEINSDYDSGADSDFAPTGVHHDDDPDSSDSDSDSDSSTPATTTTNKRKRSATPPTAAPKTRSQRLASPAPRAGGVSSGTVTTDVDALWAAMNTPAAPAPAAPTAVADSSILPPSETGEKMVSITHTYEFAGKTTTESKLVPIASETARAYFTSVAAAPATVSSPSSSSNPTRRPPPKKRASAFDTAAAARSKSVAGPVKINTLEKSRLDWAGFVDKEGIGDDLKKWNKGDKGFLDRQAFLGRVDENRDRQWKEGSKK